ncbi:hypothetical protein TeGR_g12113 [Tetraparma gracilis]|uniref:Glycerophosphocholine acyltransferase 1 n=1 Tax=Tetraparma gracilis TaxID=2962635 RepID=A0ABQ6MZL0_9STRA|nr:hypothetical protein TeGR_g12113 [Tetraparma gracilis]
MSASNATASCDYFMRGQFLGECSGHGTCLPEAPNEYMKTSVGRCECDEGWLAGSDFQSATGMDCFYNEKINNTWYVVNSILWLVSLVYTSIVLRSLHAAHTAKKKKGKTKAPFFQGASNRAMSYAVVFCFFRLADAALRCGTGYTSANNLLVAIVHCIPGFIFWSQLAAVECESFMQIVMGQAKMAGPDGEKMKKDIEGMKKLMKTLIPLAAPAYTMVIVCYFDQNPNHQKYYSLVYYIGHFILSHVLVNRVALPVSRSFLTILDAVPNRDAKTEALYKKVFIFNREVRNAGYFNTLTTLMMICWPFLWNWQGYQLMFAWPSCVPLLNVAAYLVHNTTNKGGGKVSPGSTAVTTASVSSE